MNSILFMLPITSWSYFSLLCPSYGSVWILVKYGYSKQGFGAMSCLAQYIQTVIRILKSSKEMRHNRFKRKSVAKMNVKCSQLSQGFPS